MSKSIDDDASVARIIHVLPFRYEHTPAALRDVIITLKVLFSSSFLHQLSGQLREIERGNSIAKNKTEIAKIIDLLMNRATRESTRYFVFLCVPKEVEHIFFSSFSR